MLTENEVVEAVRNTLVAEGWQIVGTSTTLQQGADIEAHREGVRLIVEAKGETSSKAKTNRFGLPFHRGQVLTHVSRAVYTALVAQEDGKTLAAVAFPWTELHINEVAKVERTLRSLNIRVFWVKASDVVGSSLR